MNQLPPDDSNLENFRLEVQTEADLLVEEYTKIATDILNKVPARVQENLKTFRFNWAILDSFLVNNSTNVDGTDL